MAPGSFRFDNFLLDPVDRQLKRDGAPVELNARYLDALALLVRDAGKLVSKDRFMDEVWRGVPVTDEALTQCIKTIRRQLGDNAASPRFIETVPKHGYRFIAAVEWVLDEVSGADMSTTVAGGTPDLEMNAATSTVGTLTSAASTPTSNVATAAGTVTSQTVPGTPTFSSIGATTSDG